MNAKKLFEGTREVVNELWSLQQSIDESVVYTPFEHKNGNKVVVSIYDDGCDIVIKCLSCNEKNVLKINNQLNDGENFFDFEAEQVAKFLGYITKLQFVE